MSETAGVRDLVVWITGTGSGIGNALAQSFAGDGAIVAGCDLPGGLEASREVCAFAGAADVTKPTQLSAFVDEVRRRFGRIDALVANAGIFRRGSIEEAPWADIEDVVRVNLFGVLHAIRAVLPVMREQGHGRIVATASRTAEICARNRVGYTTSKAGVVAAVRTLAHELRDVDILANCLIPGRSMTAMFGKGRDPAGAYPTARMLATLPTGGPSGRTFFDETEYDIYRGFWDESREFAETPDPPRPAGR